MPRWKLLWLFEEEIRHREHVVSKGVNDKLARLHSLPVDGISPPELLLALSALLVNPADDNGLLVCLNVLLLELFEERVKFLNIPGPDEVQEVKVDLAKVYSAHLDLVGALDFLDNLVHVNL